MLECKIGVSTSNSTRYSDVTMKMMVFSQSIVSCVYRGREAEKLQCGNGPGAPEFHKGRSDDEGVADGPTSEILVEFLL